jgi:hypothetical protein
MRRGKARPKTSKDMSIAHPPQLNSNVILNHRYRFTSATATVIPITPSLLLTAAGSVCTVANTTVTSFFGSVKVNSIEIWAPPASQGSTSTCSVEWNVVNSSQSTKEVSDTSNSVSFPAHIRCVPPAKSLASFWQTQSSTAYFQIVAPSGSIIDLNLSLTMYDDDAGTSQATRAVGAGSLGLVYYMSLGAAGVYPPVSLTTTT